MNTLNNHSAMALTERDLIEIDGEARMHDLRIAEALGFDRPRNIRNLIQRNIERLEQHGLICFTAKQIKSNAQNPRGAGRIAKAFYLNEAQAYRLCMWSDAPNANAVQEQMVEVFLAWRHGKLSVHQPAATPHEVTVSGFTPNALGQFGGVSRNVLRKRDGEMITRFEEAIDQAVIDYARAAVPRVSSFVKDVAEERMKPFSDKLDQLIGVVEGMRRDMDARQQLDNEPIVLKPMAFYRNAAPQSQGNLALPKMDLRAFRTAMGWTLEDVAKMIGASTACVSKHEKGLTIPSLQFLDCYHKISGGKLTAETFNEAYRARKIQEGRWGSVPPRSMRRAKSAPKGDQS